MAQLVLASGSAYRKALLERLGLPFVVFSPNVDEAPLAGEMPSQTALRLSLQKAQAAADRGALIIGCDQVASCGVRRYGKPGSHQNAARQLRELSGKTVVFDTAVTSTRAKAATNRASSLVVSRSGTSTSAASRPT